ncbi:MAG: AzlC family ABC transporter permease [Burkholderiales bacterium]|nr:AzlC family ABC transporter permease [Burkholderiales bacterium]
MRSAKIVAFPPPTVEAESPRAEFLAGARDIAPMLIGTMPFGFVAGVAAISAGMSALEGMALSMFSFSGIAQLIVSQLIAAKSPLVVTIAAAAVVSLRFVMYSAAISHHLAHLDRRWRAVLAFLMTDQSFAMTMKRYAQPRETRHAHWFFLGSALTLYLSWQAAVAIGIVLGAQVPAEWSLDFAVVLCFIALLVPVVKTRANLAAALVATAVAIVAAGLPYRLALVVASIAGIAAGLAVEMLHRRA